MAQVGLLEDNVRIARLCATMLQYAGHQVTIYEHPRECLAALTSPIGRREKSVSVARPILPIDVLILDLHLPNIDGLDVLRSLQAHPETRSLPLIFCTAAAPSEVALALRVAPQAGVIEKPFTIQALTSAISSVLTPSSTK
uniref:Response regulator n=1 Tax=Thermosporothrix sp. COM3 TaxID=2490863 RepID=A0A455SZ63_9CHLR|nr:response regulator [Thermosporothrix sp. COM3]